MPDLQNITYRADATGLVYGYLFHADGTATTIDSHAAAEWLRDGGDASSFLWLHFDGAHHATPGWLREHVELPPEFDEALHEGWRSTRIEQVQDGLIAVINDVVYDMLQASSLQVATLWVAIGLHQGRRYVISQRNQPLRSVDRLRRAVNAGEGFASPLGVIVHLLRDQADVLGQILRRATEEVDHIEDRFLADRLPDRTQLGRLRRDLVRMQRLLAPEPGALFRLLSRPPRWADADEAGELRQATEEFSLVLRDISGLQERIKLIQEEVVALTADRMNKSIFVLTAVTVIALPINITAGLLGMNVEGIPLARHAQAFWIVVIVLALVTAVAAWLLLRQPDD